MCPLHWMLREQQCLMEMESTQQTMLKQRNTINCQHLNRSQRLQCTGLKYQVLSDGKIWVPPLHGSTPVFSILYPGSEQNKPHAPGSMVKILSSMAPGTPAPKDPVETVFQMAASHTCLSWNTSPALIAPTIAGVPASSLISISFRYL